MSALQIVQVIHNGAVILLALVGFHSLVMAVIYLWTRRKTPVLPHIDNPTWPKVVVQLPIYNERHVTERLVEAVSRLDYPPDGLAIQLLDDSTDDTTSIAAPAVERARQAGLVVEHIRRPDRRGYKAGALEYGLGRTDAPFVAIFDADFVPASDFLKRTVVPLLADSHLGLVQARWAHLNAEQSLLTRSEALALDTHFVIEQTARNRAGLLMNFAGTAGVWRREAIEDAGGWDGSTLSEDIDLSYRAQLRGWKCLYLPDLGVSAEITPLMTGFKKQQARWATGTVQCLMKLGPAVLRSRLNLWQKIEAMFHLSAYIIHPLMIVQLLTTLPLLLAGKYNPVSLAGLSLAMFGPPFETLVAQRELYPDWWRRMLYYPVLMLLGVGIAASNSEAVASGLSGRRLPFHRTPKYRVDETGKLSWASSAYTVPIDHTLLAEILLSLYAFLSAALAADAKPALVPFMLLYALGFAYVAGLSIWQTGAIRLADTRKRRMLELSGN